MITKHEPLVGEPIKGQALRLGDLFDEVGSDYYLQYFVSEVRENGLKIERVHRPYEYDYTSEKTGLRSHTLTYSILPNHGSFVPFNDNFWNRRYIRTGSMPALAGHRFVKIPLEGNTKEISEHYR